MLNPSAARLLACIVIALLGACPAAADAWQDERYHLSMQPPDDWVPMSDALLAQTNAQVSHLTGRGFIAGYAFHETDTLVFPYMLVQFKPYTTLPARYHPVAKLDERDRLELLYALVSAFRELGPLPETIDTPQFIDQFGNKHARLIRLDDDGRFDFTGQIPHEKGQVPIHYHTHGIPGRDGIALVSVFTIDDFSGLTYVIQNEMRTLGFDAGFGADALPDEPPAPVPTSPESPTESTLDNEPVAATSIEPSPPTEQAAQDQMQDQMPKAEDTQPVSTAPTHNPGNSNALVLILSLLGAVLIITIGVVWFVTHQKAKAERERRRARKERILAAQQSASTQHEPRQAQPPTVRSHGSSGRRTAGRTRS